MTLVIIEVPDEAAVERLRHTPNLRVVRIVAAETGAESPAMEKPRSWVGLLPPAAGERMLGELTALRDEWERFLIDTNTVIELVTGLLPPAGSAWVDGLVLRNEHAISVINWIELLVYPKSVQEKTVLELFVANSLVLPVEAQVVRQTIQLHQTYRTKLPDAIVAATALVHGLVLVSRNTNDFGRIAGLQTINPHVATQLLTS